MVNEKLTSGCVKSPRFPGRSSRWLRSTKHFREVKQNEENSHRCRVFYAWEKHILYLRSLGLRAWEFTYRYKKNKNWNYSNSHIKIQNCKKTTCNMLSTAEYSFMLIYIVRSVILYDQYCIYFVYLISNAATSYWIQICRRNDGN